LRGSTCFFFVLLVLAGKNEKREATILPDRFFYGKGEDHSSNCKEKKIKVKKEFAESHFFL
jgi:hypothetical protein